MAEPFFNADLSYSLVRTVHISAVLLSGSLFLVRGLALQVGSAWAMRPPARYSSYAVDTVLLAAGLMLLALLPEGVFANGWLTVKLVLLPAYIVAGSIALKRGRSELQKRLALVLALLLYASMFVIARAHDPMAPACAILPGC